MSLSTGDGSMTHPDWFLRCEKEVNGSWVTTGWAPDLKAAESHALSVGGTVVVTDKNSVRLATFSDPWPMPDNVRAELETDTNELATTEQVC